MKLLFLHTGFWMAAFPDYTSAKAFAEERRGQRYKVAYCGNMEWYCQWM